MTTLLIYLLINSARASEHPCEEIKAACEAAKFTGHALWKECIEPLVEGKPAAKDAKPLPKVDAAVITACKTKHGMDGAHH